MPETLSTDPSARRSQQPGLRDMPERGPQLPEPAPELRPAGKPARRADKPVAEAPRPTEEVAVVPVGHKRRQGRRVGIRTPAPLTAQQAYDLA